MRHLKTVMGPQKPASILQKPVRGPQRHIRAVSVPETEMGPSEAGVGRGTFRGWFGLLGASLEPSETSTGPAKSSLRPSETELGTQRLIWVLTGQHGALRG